MHPRRRPTTHEMRTHIHYCKQPMYCTKQTQPPTIAFLLLHIVQHYAELGVASAVPPQRSSQEIAPVSMKTAQCHGKTRARPTAIPRRPTALAVWGT